MLVLYMILKQYKIMYQPINNKINKNRNKKVNKINKNLNKKFNKINRNNKIIKNSVYVELVNQKNNNKNIKK